MSDLFDFEDRADRLELMKTLAGLPAAKAAHREIVELKREYEANLGRTLMQAGNTAPFNQREIDYQRGYWRGMLWAFTVLLANAGPKLQKLLEKELAERDGESA